MLAPVVALAGCPSTPAAPDDASSEDAGSDLGAADTGTAPDVKPVDAGAPDAGSPDVPEPVDVPPAKDVPTPIDVPAPMDVPVTPIDVLPVDVPPAVDVPPVPEDRGPPPAACESAALVDLNARASADGGVSRYVGTTASAPRGPSLRATCVGADGMGEAIHQVVHRYVPRVTGRLRVSVDDAATDAAFDTLLFAQRDCFALRMGEEPLGCNDDVDESLAMRPRASAFITPRVVAGAPVYVVVAGYPRGVGDPLRPQGAYALTVTELPEVPLGASCDVTGATNACAPATTCLDGGAGSAPRCTADGVANTHCREGAAAECDAGLRCADGFCRRALAEGAACGPDVAGVCPESWSCQWVDGANRCVRTGSRGGDCRDEGTRCDTGLACVHTRFGDHCLTAVASGGACDPWGLRNACAAGSVCGFAPLGATGTCVAPGGTAGAPCRPGASRCDTGLECRTGPDGENELCYRAIAPSGACDPLGGVNICSMDTDCVPNTPLTAGVCVAPGTAPGAPCRGDDPRCDSGISCSVTAGEGHCQRTLIDGATCDLRYGSTRCTGGSCVPDSATAATCRTAAPEREPNDTVATASPFTGAYAVAGGALNGTDARDCIRVTVAEGSSLVVETYTGDDRTCERADGDPSVSLYGPSGALILTEDDSPGRGLCSTIAPWSHPQAIGLAAGAYTVCVGRGAAAVPRYRLSVATYR